MMRKKYRILNIEGLLKLYVRIGNKFPLLLQLHQKYGRTNVVSHYGVLMKKNWEDITFRFCVSAAYGEFLSNYLDEQTENFAFFDIGANQGLYSLIANKNPHCTGVIAFEPVSSTFQLLKQNVDINGAANKSLLINKALGERSGSLKIKMPVNHSGGASMVLHSDAGGELYTEEEIEIVSSEFLNELEMPKTDKIICKIDVEGNEASVIEALAGSHIIERIRVIFYEVDERWVEPAEIEKRLREFGFCEFKKIGSGTHYDVLATRRVR